MRVPSFVPAMLITLALAPACGKSDDEAPAEAPDTVAVPVDVPVDSGMATVEFIPVELPAEFPSDFPIAPASTIVSASSTPDAGGSYSEVSIAAEGDAAEIYRWYRQALTDAGWQVSNEGQTDETRTLHATQGESYVDLTAMPHPERATGWVRVSASIWKTGT